MTRQQKIEANQRMARTYALNASAPDEADERMFWERISEHPECSIEVARDITNNDKESRHNKARYAAGDYVRFVARRKFHALTDD